MTQPLVERQVPAVTPSWVATLIRGMAAQDWLITTYFALLLIALAVGNGPGRAECAERVLLDFSCFALGILATRGGLLRPHSFASGLVYRLTVFLTVFLSYFQLREILPAVSSRWLDAEILAFDLKVFGVEPSLAWDRFVTPATTEWFAFFYFGYFFLLTVHVLPMMLGARDQDLLAHFSLGVFIVFCTGHLVYMAVPGWGPYWYLADRFEHPLAGGIFWGLVKSAVEVGGAQKDIFPSLHTAVPTFFALFSVRFRHMVPFKYTWPFMLFVSFQIICATMFLRWHYLVDIAAGLTLAVAAVWIPARVIPWERRRRAELGVAPTYTRLLWPWQREKPSIS